jgi:hypothetical protein
MTWSPALRHSDLLRQVGAQAQKARPRTSRFPTINPSLISIQTRSLYIGRNSDWCLFRTMKCYTLQTSPSKDDDSWRFSVPQEALLPPRKSKGIFGKFIKFTPQAITFEMANLPSNRILHSDDPSKFILLSFGDLRFPEANLKASGEYIARLMKAGLFLNNIQYRFYHHSNSQLVRLRLH